ncbi:hypothetical protein JQ607_07470 [Bradyrhizobium liaoningense]|uniref:hypothetical protein n=1 Tax=Bradyrhizobium liaoningense TaxID=43992 RepID=UPI001BA96ECA|nr:hypothetical protein [Bradyrhizobium liaoningense]MBR0840031.1 hypothetical protein [Bradyrhizobium liaoningense]MBR0854173.1 hypothetical protein [Bradyrhizobium liaoningense]
MSHLILGRRTRLDLPHVTAFTSGTQSRMWSLDFLMSESKVLRRPSEVCAIVERLQWSA